MEAKAPPLLDELSPQQFATWRQHPVSKLIMDRYLGDFRQALERQFLEAFVAGNVTPETMQTTRGRLMAAHLVETLNLDSVREFYGMTPLSAGTLSEPVENELRGPQ